MCAGISWAGYAQSMPTPGDLVSSGDYSADELPFAQYSYVYDNTPAYLQEHLLPLTQLSTDLQDPNRSHDEGFFRCPLRATQADAATANAASHRDGRRARRAPRAGLQPACDLEG